MGVVKLSTAGINSYQKYSSMLAGNAGFSPFAYTLLESVVAGSDVATVTFSDLVSKYASTYKHLQIRYSARSTFASADGALYLQFNGDTAGNYRSHYLTATGSSVVSADVTSSYPNGVHVGFGVTGANSAANNFGAGIIDLLDAFVTTKNTTVSIFAGSTDLNRIAMASGVWFNTAALNSLVFDDIFGNIVQNSRFSLYGIRG